MSAQHTPATWTPYVCGRSLDEMPEYLRVCIANSGGSEFRMVAGFDERGQVDVCMVGNGPRGEANARLIAAAPELLGACEAFMALFNDCDMRPEDEAHEVASTIRRAITKAKGVA